MPYNYAYAESADASSSGLLAWTDILTRLQANLPSDDAALGQIADERHRVRLAKHFGRMTDTTSSALALGSEEAHRENGETPAGLQKTASELSPCPVRAAFENRDVSRPESSNDTGPDDRFILAKARTIHGRQRGKQDTAGIGTEPVVDENSTATEDGMGDTAPAAKSGTQPLASVADARAMLASGDYASGAAALIALEDASEDAVTREEADYSVRLLWREATAGSLSEEQLDAVEAALPAWDTLASAEAANQVMLFSYLRAGRCSKAGDAVKAHDYFLQAQHQAAEIMEIFPEASVLVSTVRAYVDASVNLEDADARAALDWCLEKAMAKETPKALAFSLRTATAPAIYRKWRDRTHAIILYKDASIDGDGEEFAGWVADVNTFSWVRAELYFAHALSLYDLGKRVRAAEVFAAALAAAPEGDELVYRAALSRQYVLNLLQYYDYEACLQGLQSYLDTYPESPYIDRALLYMAEVYERAENTMAAYDTYGKIIDLFPASPLRPGAERGRAFLEAHVLNSQGGMEVPERMPVLAAPQLAMACGPDALHRMLALQGIPAAGSDLASLSAMKENGTSMLGLVAAARGKGADVVGVQVDDISRLCAPFVAHTNVNHFFLVTRVGEEIVEVREGCGLRVIPRNSFLEMATGLALVNRNAAEGLENVSDATLKLAMGGQQDPIFPPPAPTTCPNGDPPTCPAPTPPVPPNSGGGGGGGGGGDDPPPPRCPAGDADGEGQGTMGKPGMRLGGGGGGSSHVPGMVDPGKGIFGSGITAPEMSFRIMGRQGSQHARQTDISVPVRGGELNLEFSRTYFNSWGTPENSSLQSIRDLGVGWFHPYQDYAVFSSNTVTGKPNTPVGVALNISQTTRVYVYYNTDAQGVDEYRIDGTFDVNNGTSGGSQTDELGNKVYRNPSTGFYKLVYPDNSSRVFSGVYGYMLSRSDRNGNTISLNYDWGLLDTITGPDDRYLQLYWDNYGRISSVELRKWTGGGQSTSLRAVSYTYTDTTSFASLSRVTYSDTSYNEFSYGKKDAADPYYAYITDFRDRAGLHTTFTATYNYDANLPTWFRVTCQTVSHSATGLYSVYDQTNATGSLVAVSQYSAPSGGTLMSKALFYGDSSAFANSQEQYYADATGTTKRIWYYDYSQANYRDLNQIIDPAYLYTYKYEYNVRGQVTKMYRTPACPPLQFQYDSTGLRPTKRIDPNLAESTYTYDTAGNITYYHHPSMGTASVQYAYDSYGQMTSMTDARGKTWTYTYDTRGNQTSVTDPNSHTTTLTYDDFGRVLSVLDPMNKLTEFEYTDSICGGCGAAQSQIALIRDHDDNETTFEYDSAGMLLRVENAAGQAVVNTYDTMHRLTQVTRENGPLVAAYTYDALNRVVATADGDGNAISYTYNFLGDLTAVTDAEGTTQLVYYNNGNLRQIVDGKNNTTNFYYYNAGGLAKMVNALGQTVKYTYDVMGNLTQVGAGTNGDVDTISYTYPASSSTSTGLLQSVTYVNEGVSKTVSYTYNTNGQVTAVNDWMGTSGGTHSFEYDDAGQLVKYTDFDGAYQQYTYDNAGNLSTLRDYEGNTTTYGYDNLHRLVSLAAPGGKNWGFTYDPVGRLLTQTLPNGLSSETGYDTLGRPASLQHKDGSTVVEGWNYTYDKNDNLRTIASARTGDAGAWTYLYDGRNRLREAFRKNSAGALVSRHGFEYDAGDNLSSKTVTPYTQQFQDTFSDGNITASPAWLSTGAWSATAQEAVNTANASINPEISQNIANSDGEYWYSYKIEDVSVSGARTRLLLRRTNATNDCIRILFNANSFNIKQQSGGVTTDLLTNSSIVTASDTWYDVYVRAAGGTIEVWRGLRGEKLSFVGKVTNATVLSGEALAFDTNYNIVAHFDDLRMCTARTANQSYTNTFTGSFDGWVAETGTWSAASNYLTNTSTGVQGKMRRDTANGDFQMKFCYRDTSATPGPWAQVRFRHADSNNYPYLTLTPSSFTLSERRAGTAATLATGSWTTTSGTWYDVTLIADGSHIEVWRGPKDGAQTRMCSVDTAQVLSGTASYLVVTVNGTYAFDDVQVTAEDLSSTTYTYDTANQLTAMNVNGATTNFTYDDWGRMAGKTQGSYAATYGYRYGDKLKAVTSSFPGETASVAYNYDGLGKRRVEQLGTSTITWFRWLGMEESGEYTGTSGSWTVGAMQTGYVPGLATFAGSNPTTAEWRYPLTDHLGSVRQLSAQNKAALARYDYAPYGELMRSAGLPLTVGYTGHRWDSAIGQYFAPFRYYNPQTARWNMRDPLGFVDGPNVYAYVAGNPVNYMDPRGRNLVGGLIGAMAGGLGSYACGNRGRDLVADIAGGFVGGMLSGLIGAGLGAMVSAGIRHGFGSGGLTWQSTAAGTGGAAAGWTMERTLRSLEINIGSIPNWEDINDPVLNTAINVPSNTRSRIMRRAVSRSIAGLAGTVFGTGVELLINAITGNC